MKMQEEPYVKQQPIEIPDDFQIIKLVQMTYHSKTTSQVQYAQSALNQLLVHDLFVQKLFYFLESHQQLNQSIPNPDQFKLSLAFLIKKFSYSYAKLSTAKDFFIQKLFTLLISLIPIRAKEQLGIGLQYILNQDIHNVYKPKVFAQLAQILESLPQPCILQGALAVATASLNSLIEVEEQSIFVLNIFNYLIQNAIIILETIRKNTDDQVFSGTAIDLFKLSKRVFDLLQLAISRMVDEEDIVQDKLDEIRKSQGFHLLLFSYLSSYGANKSIVSSVPHINNVKEIVIEIVFALYKTKPMPLNLFHLCLITFLLESEREVYQEEEEHIISRILEILEEYLEQKIYTNEFSDHKRQILYCLLTYSLTKPDQIDLLEDSPQRFIQIAEDYTEGFRGSTNIKVRAGSFLKVYVTHFDEGLRSIMEWIVVIITATLEKDDPNSVSVQIYNQIKLQSSGTGFFKVDSTLQLQTCFNALSLLYPLIKRRDDLNRIVYAIMTTHANGLQQLNHPIEIIRLIRMVGYYPSAIFYDYIKNKMSMGNVFIIQGFKAFERILRSAKFPQIFEILSEIFEELINVMNVNDRIFQTIVMNHYERVLKKNPKLFDAFLIKLRDTFIQNIEKNQHITFSCLGFICAILVKENEPKLREKISQYFFTMEEFYDNVMGFYLKKEKEEKDPTQFAANTKIVKNLKHYKDKIVQIYSVLVKKETVISERMIAFALKKLPTLINYNKNEEIFTMYHRIFLKVGAEYDGIPFFYEGLMDHVRKMFVSIIDPTQSSDNHFAQSLQILPNLCYLISQILASWNSINLAQEDILWILNVMNSITEEVRQYLLLLILTYTYNNPMNLRNTLESINAYQETLQYFLSTRYEEGLIRKIFLLAMSKLIEIEEKYVNEISKECIKYLKEQFEKNEVKRKPKEQIDPKMRRLVVEAAEYEEEEVIAQEQKTNLIPVTCCVPDFKHPWMVLSEYDHFKIRIWQNSDIEAKLAKAEKKQLREVMKMDWVGKKVRKIVSVKHPLL